LSKRLNDLLYNILNLSVTLNESISKISGRNVDDNIACKRYEMQAISYK